MTELAAMTATDDTKSCDQRERRFPLATDFNKIIFQKTAFDLKSYFAVFNDDLQAFVGVCCSECSRGDPCLQWLAEHSTS